MSKNRTIKGFALEKENANWLEKRCKEERLSQSQVINKMVRKARESNILW